MTPNERNTVRRYPNRGNYDMEKLIEVLNRNFIAQVSFQIEGQPFVIPMNYVNDDEFIYFHGSKDSRIINVLKKGTPVAISILEVCGVVIRRKVVDNSIHYVSAIIFGTGNTVNETHKKVQVFKSLMDRIAPGRWEDSVLPDHNDIDKVEVVSVRIEDFSIKINLDTSMNPDDLKIWQGIIPIKTSYGPARSYSKVKIPDYIMKINGKIFYQ